MAGGDSQKYVLPTLRECSVVYEGVGEMKGRPKVPGCEPE